MCIKMSSLFNNNLEAEAGDYILKVVAIADNINSHTGRYLRADSCTKLDDWGVFQVFFSRKDNTKISAHHTAFLKRIFRVEKCIGDTFFINKLDLSNGVAFLRPGFKPIKMV